MTHNTFSWKLVYLPLQGLVREYSRTSEERALLPGNRSCNTERNSQCTSKISWARAWWLYIMFCVIYHGNLRKDIVLYRTLKFKMSWFLSRILIIIASNQCLVPEQCKGVVSWCSPYIIDTLPQIRNHMIHLTGGPVLFVIIFYLKYLESVIAIVMFPWACCCSSFSHDRLSAGHHSWTSGGNPPSLVGPVWSLLTAMQHVQVCVPVISGYSWQNKSTGRLDEFNLVLYSVWSISKANWPNCFKQVVIYILLSQVFV